MRENTLFCTMLTINNNSSRLRFVCLPLVRDRYFHRARRCCNLLKPLSYKMLASNSDHFHQENTFNFQSKDYTSCFARINLLRLLQSLKVEDKADSFSLGLRFNATPSTRSFFLTCFKRCIFLHPSLLPYEGF